MLTTSRSRKRRALLQRGAGLRRSGDSGGNRVYNVTVQATDEGRNTASINVTVTVTNENEPGTVTLSHLQPQVGESLTARLSDPDGGTRSITWQWYRGDADGTDNVRGSTHPTKCSDPNAAIPCAIDGARSATYRPIVADHDATDQSPDGQWPDTQTDSAADRCAWEISEPCPRG